MNMKEVRELIELISEKGFSEFEIERQGFRLRIAQFGTPPQIAFHPAGTSMAESGPAAAPSAEAQLAGGSPSPELAQAAIVTEELHIIKSPLVGTFYRSPSPASEPFVKPGDLVDPDSIVCIIEAMKLMNNVQAEVNGEVVKVFVENGQPVEYGQPLFGIRA